MPYGYHHKPQVGGHHMGDKKKKSSPVATAESTYFRVDQKKEKLFTIITSYYHIILSHVL